MTEIQALVAMLDRTSINYYQTHNYDGTLVTVYHGAGRPGIVWHFDSYGTLLKVTEEKI